MTIERNIDLHCLVNEPKLFECETMQTLRDASAA